MGIRRGCNEYRELTHKQPTLARKSGKGAWLFAPSRVWPPEQVPGVQDNHSASLKYSPVVQLFIVKITTGYQNVVFAFKGDAIHPVTFG